MKTSLYLNSALLNNKLGKHSQAVEDATKALEIEGIGEKDKGKALFRRAQARSAKKNDEEAVRDLEEALKMVPGDAAVVKDLEAARKRVKERKEREKKAYAKAFDF